MVSATKAYFIFQELYFSASVLFSSISHMFIFKYLTNATLSQLAQSTQYHRIPFVVVDSSKVRALFSPPSVILMIHCPSIPPKELTLYHLEKQFKGQVKKVDLCEHLVKKS